MATARKVTLTTLKGSDVRTLIEEHNKLVTDVAAIITAAATDIAAVAAVVPTAAKLQNNAGTEITETAG